jgi:hypothetical protein
VEDTLIVLPGNPAHSIYQSAINKVTNGVADPAGNTPVTGTEAGVAAGHETTSQYHLLESALVLADMPTTIIRKRTSESISIRESVLPTCATMSSAILTLSGSSNSWILLVKLISSVISAPTIQIDLGLDVGKKRTSLEHLVEITEQLSRGRIHSIHWHGKCLTPCRAGQLD